MATVIADSGIQPGDESYERALVYAEWDPAHPSRVCRVVVKVHRRIEESSATAYVWQDDGGWVELHTWSADEWWDNVPGFMRWQQARARTKTLQVADDLITQVQKVAETGSLS